MVIMDTAELNAAAELRLQYASKMSGHNSSCQRIA